MHTWTRTAAPEQQVLILRSAACRSRILGLSSTIGGRSCGPLTGHKQPASGPGGRRAASKRFTICTDQTRQLQDLARCAAAVNRSSQRRDRRVGRARDGQYSGPQARRRGA